MTRQTLILLPGLLCDKSVWEHQINHLSDEVDIIVPDFSAASTPDEMVKAVLANAPDSFALAGHSMGGWVALEVMRHHGHCVEQLLLINTSALLDSPAKVESRKTLIHLFKEKKNDEIIERLLNAFYYLPKIKPALKAMLERNIHSLYNQERAMQMREDCVPVLSTIRCPTLIIHANQDEVFHFEDSEILHSGIAGSKLARIEGCGHMSPMEAAEEVTRLMKGWLGMKKRE